MSATGFAALPQQQPHPQMPVITQAYDNYAMGP